MLFNPVPENNFYCEEWLPLYTGYFIITSLVLPIIMLVINDVSNALLSHYTKKENHHDLGKEKVSLAVKQTMVNIVNTGLIMLFIYPGRLFTTEWYTKSGNALVMAFFLKLI
jgi:hypothetical protein